MAQEKDLRERARKVNDLERDKLKSFRADLEREKANLEAKKPCNVLAQAYNNNSEMWQIAAWTVGGLTCFIPVIFVFGTMVEIQVAVCRRLSVWVFRIFGI